MTFMDINKRYSEVIREYLSKGYTINIGTMGGTQRELAKTDFTNGQELIRVMVVPFNDYSTCIEGLEIRVGRVKDIENLDPQNSKPGDVIWNHHLETLSCERFFEVGKNRCGAYYGSQEDAVRAINIRRKRWVVREAPAPKSYTSKRAAEIAERIILNHFPGARKKRKAQGHVERISSISGAIYNVFYNDRIFTVSY